LRDRDIYSVKQLKEIGRTFRCNKIEMYFDSLIWIHQKKMNRAKRETKKPERFSDIQLSLNKGIYHGWTDTYQRVYIKQEQLVNTNSNYSAPTLHCGYNDDGFVVSDSKIESSTDVDDEEEEEIDDDSDDDSEDDSDDEEEDEEEDESDDEEDDEEE